MKTVYCLIVKKHQARILASSSYLVQKEIIQKLQTDFWPIAKRNKDDKGNGDFDERTNLIQSKISEELEGKLTETEGLRLSKTSAGMAAGERSEEKGKASSGTTGILEEAQERARHRIGLGYTSGHEKLIRLFPCTRRRRYPRYA